MNVEAMNTAANPTIRLSDAAEKVAADRKGKDDAAQEPQAEKSKVAPEELLQQIKSLTEEGLYSVRFEKDRLADLLVVKIVDRETDEIIRQIPAEEIIELRAALDELTGNIVDTSS